MATKAEQVHDTARPSVKVLKIAVKLHLRLTIDSQ